MALGVALYHGSGVIILYYDPKISFLPQQIQQPVVSFEMGRYRSLWGVIASPRSLRRSTVLSLPNDHFGLFCWQESNIFALLQPN